MTLPLPSQIDTGSLDDGADSPADARVLLLQYAETLKQLIDAIDVANGLAVKDANNKIPAADLFEVDETLEFHLAGGVRTLRHVNDRIGAEIVGSDSNTRFITRIRRDAKGHVLDVQDAPVQQISGVLYTAWSGAVANLSSAWANAGYQALLAIPATAICGGLEERNDAGGGGNKNLRARYYQYVT